MVNNEVWHGCIFIPFEDAQRIKEVDKMSVFEAIGKVLSKPAAKVGIAAAGAGAAAGSVLGASAASPTINNKSDSTTVGNVKIRPLMDGNMVIVVLKYFLELIVKIRPLMDGNFIIFLYN